VHRSSSFAAIESSKKLADEALMISRKHNQIYLLTVYKVVELICY
jgi:hypothetical protein